MNNICLLGRLTVDPELKTTPNGVSVTSFNLAVDRYTSGERKADFIPIVAWRATAEFITRYFRKGDMIAVNGTLTTRPYRDKEGNKRTVFEVVANNVYFAGSKNNTQSAAEGNKTESADSFSPTFPDFTEITVNEEDLPF